MHYLNLDIDFDYLIEAIKLNIFIKTSPTHPGYLK